MSQTDRLLEAALEQYDLEPLPSGFVGRTMSRVEAQSRHRFRIVDIAIAISLAGVAAVVVGLWWSLPYLDPMAWKSLELGLRGLWLSSFARPPDYFGLLLLASGSAVLSVPVAVSMTERRLATST